MNITKHDRITATHKIRTSYNVDWKQKGNSFFTCCHEKVTGGLRILLFSQRELFSKGHNELFVLLNTEVKKCILEAQFSNSGFANLFTIRKTLFREG